MSEVLRDPQEPSVVFRVYWDPYRSTWGSTVVRGSFFLSSAGDRVLDRSAGSLRGGH